MRKILLLPALVLILCSYTWAITYWSDDFEDGNYNGWDTILNEGGSHTIETTTVHTGTYSLKLTGNSGQFHSIQNTGVTYEGKGERGNFTFWINYDSGNSRIILMQNETANIVLLTSSTTLQCQNGAFTIGTLSGGWDEVTVNIDETNLNTSYYLNGAISNACNHIIAGNITKIDISNINSASVYYYDDFTFKTSDESDTNPPVITALNCTSCNPPSGDTTPPFQTEDTTPTFNITTSETASCRIGVQDINYTAMSASRNCTTTGTTSHICTLSTQDLFTAVGENNLYISCIDSTGNEGNATDSSKSNSGAIRMEIMGATETNGVNSIQIGILASEIGGTATIYTSQRASARNLAGTQFSGIFDKMAINGNKRWLFNYVSQGETPISNLFNITPVIYVLQLQNKTNETITDLVGKMINTTW